MLTALLIATSLQTQTPAPAAPPPAADAASERAAAAAERAAAAAEKAAEASARMAAAVEKLGEVLGRPAAPAAPATEEKKEALKPDVWKGTVGLGLISITGNASTLTFNGLASAERKTERWIYSLRAQGVYGRSRLPATETGPERSEVVALGAAAQLRADRRFSQVVSGYLLGGAETDHIKSVEARGLGEAGAAILWWDEKRTDGRVTSLRTDLAFRYARELRFQYYPIRMDLPDVDVGGPRFGVGFRYGLSKDVLFTQDAEAVLSVIEGSRLLVNSQSKLSVGLTDTLAIATSFVVQYDSAPPPNKVSTDTALAVSLEVGF